MSDRERSERFNYDYEYSEELDARPRTGVSPGKSTLTSRLAPAPQTNIVFRVADPATAQALATAMSPRDDNGVAAGAGDAVARANSSGGSPLPEDVRGRFEQSLGADLSSVRVHTGSESAEAAAAVGAKAYTTGQDIHFGAGQYDPIDPFGLHLLAHEVAHTVQQSGQQARMQAKLAVSSPGDAAEVEADRAADAMVAGQPATVSSAGSTINRDPFTPGVTVKPIGPVDNDPFDLFPDQPQPGQPPVGPKADAYSGDLKYNIPTTPVKGNYGPTPPPLSSEMPTANAPVPALGPPGWVVDVPPREYDFGGIKYTQPGGKVTVAGNQHSANGKGAWQQWKSYIGDVNSCWNTGGRTILNSIAQKGKGNEKIDKLVAQMQSTFNIKVARNQTITDTGRAHRTGTQQNPGQSIKDVDQQVAERAKDKDLQEDMKRSSDVGGNKDNPIRKKVKAVNRAINKVKQEAGLLTSASDALDGLQTELGGAKDTLDRVNLKKEIEEAEERKSELESGMNLVKTVSPEIARLIGMAKSAKTEMTKAMKPYYDLTTSSVKVAGGDITAVGDVLSASVSLINMGEMRKLGQSISSKASSLKAKEFSAAKKAVQGISKQVDAKLGEIEERQGKLKDAHADAKQKYDELASEIEKGGLVGKDGKRVANKDSKLVAEALEALPPVKKLVRTLVVAKTELPKTPDANTRALQGHTLAVKGLYGPGATEVYKVLGWIEGAHATVQDELQTWQTTEKALESFVANLGVGDPEFV